MTTREQLAQRLTALRQQGLLIADVRCDRCGHQGVWDPIDGIVFHQDPELRGCNLHLGDMSDA